MRIICLCCATLVGLVLLGGCVSRTAAAPGADRMAGACQMRPCRCIRSDLPVWSTGEPLPVRWLESGDAACPAGYRLQFSK